MSLTCTTWPSSPTRTTISSNISGSGSWPSALSWYWKATSPGSGGAPISPRELSMFWASTASITSSTAIPIADIFDSSSQIRIE